MTTLRQGGVYTWSCDISSTCGGCGGGSGCFDRGPGLCHPTGSELSIVYEVRGHSGAWLRARLYHGYMARGAPPGVNTPIVGCHFRPAGFGILCYGRGEGGRCGGGGVVRVAIRSKQNQGPRANFSWMNCK